MYPFVFPLMMVGFSSVHTFCRIYCCRFFEMVILIDVKWYLIRQLPCLSQRANDARIFSCTLRPSPWLLWRNVHLDLWPTFYWIVCFLILSCTSCLYVFFICKNFFHSEGCLFLSLMVSFVVQMLLMFLRSHLFIFVLFSWFYEVDQKRTCILCQGACSFP